MSELKAPSITQKQIRARELAWIHLDTELTDNIPDIINTLAPEGPYAYTLRCKPPVGEEVPHLEVVPTRQQIHEAYIDLHSISLIQKWEPFTEINSDWYAFHHGWATSLIKATGGHSVGETIVMFPSLGRDGITGEMFWARTTTGPTIDPADPLAHRRRMRADHDAYVAALRAGDATQIADSYVTDAQVSIRDYVADAGTVVSLHDRNEARAFYRAFFDRYRIRKLEIVERHADDWFVFAEMAWEVEALAGPRKGQVLNFRTADYAEIGPDYRVRARVGHGTDLSAD